MKIKVENLKKLARDGKNLLKKKSPAISFVFGLGATVAGTVGLCKATVKTDKDLSETKEKIEQINAADITEEEKKKEVSEVKRETAVQIVKNYAVPGLTYASGIGSLCFSHGTLTRRYAAATNAYAVLSQTFGEYRKKVADKFGTDAERALRIGETATAEHTKTLHYTDGTSTEIKETVNYRDPAAKDDMYTYRFDSSSHMWNKHSMDYNIMQVYQTECWANMMLRRQGVNTVIRDLEQLDIKPNAVASATGWVDDSSLDDYARSKQISFGIDWNHPENSIFRDPVSGEDYILLNMLVDGPVLDWFDIPREKISFKRYTAGMKSWLIRSKTDAGIALSNSEKNIISKDHRMLDKIDPDNLQ